MKDQLTRAATDFSDQPGKIAILIQSKTEPGLSVDINADNRLPSASVLKAAIACAAADQETLDLSRPIKVETLDPTFYCSILQAFEPGDTLTLKALIGLMLIVSDNPATSAVLKAVGMDKVNAWLAANGFQDTNLNIGFDDASLGAPLRANLTTAQDCLHLLQRIDTAPQYAFIKHMLANNLRNERIPKLLPDDAVIAHKTGTLNGLVHDIAIVESPIAAYYHIILADGLEDETAFMRELTAFSKTVYEIMAG